MPLPNVAYEHKELLTLNTDEVPIFKDAVEGLPGVDTQVLFADPNANVWVLRALVHPGVVMPVHYHTGTVHVLTVRGRWHYVEYPDQVQVAGSYLYEPGGSVHQFVAPADNTELTEMIMFVSGSNINFDQDGNYLGVLDASEIITSANRLARERNITDAYYISPSAPGYVRCG